MAVAEELHFGRAAARLHIAQPSLSHQIRRLEGQVGVSLLVRTSRRVELTAAGEALLVEGRELLAHARRALEHTRRASTERLTIGFYGSAATTLLPAVLRAFAVQHPAAEVTLRELLLDDLDELVSGRVEVAFSRLVPGQLAPEIGVEVIAREPRVAALPRAHRLAGRESVTFADLRDESFITNPTRRGAPPQRWLDEQRRHGLPGREAVQAASVQELLTFVASGRGISLVPAPVAEHYPRADVRYVAVTDAEPAVVSLAVRRDNRRPVVGAFAEIARRIAGEERRERAVRPRTRW